ncbi:MAG: DUF429 domain-containing protein [Cyclobacteriaceae bacterium]
MIVGIDYGSKMAGTTAICCLREGQLSIVSSLKNHDADQFILDNLSSYESQISVYIDSPLSLPGVYTGLEDCQDYFYRKSDKELSAMSPMFLGGLTARAMKLKSNLLPYGHQVLEAYPGGLARLNDLKSSGYKKETNKIAVVTQRLLNQFDLTLELSPKTWHEVDALIAFCIGLKHQNGTAHEVGDPREGTILY